MAGDTFGVRLKGPRGDVIAAQVRGNLDKIPTTWQSRMLEAVGRLAREVHLERQFDQSGGYWGTQRWQRNGGAYAVWKAEKFGAVGPGNRTGSMREAFTTSEIAAFSRVGLRMFTDIPTSIDAKPILKVEGDTLTVGAEVSEDGVEYTTDFDFTRPIFGDGRFPPGMEEEAGKVLSIPAQAALRTHEGGEPIYTEFPTGEVAAAIRKAGAGELLR